MTALAAVLDPPEPDPRAVEQAASEAFDELNRTDMRSGVANMIRRLAQLSSVQPISAEGWGVMREAARLLERNDVAAADVRALDARLQAVGLNVDLKT